jgi:hypothetical protein
MGGGWGSPQANRLVCKCADTAWITCKKLQVFLWKRWSFLAFHMYHKVIRIWVRVSSLVVVGNRWGRICWTPWAAGSIRWMKGGVFIAAQTYWGSWQRKKRWASFSIWLQTVQSLSMFVENRPAQSAVGNAWRKRRHEKVLSRGGIVLAFQILLSMLCVREEMALEPREGREWFCCCWRYM